MTVTPTSLQPGMALFGTATTVITAGAGISTIRTASVSNTTGAAVPLAVTVTRSAFPQALTIVPGLSVPPGGSLVIPDLANFVLNQGDVLKASGAGLTLFLSGWVLA